MPGQMTLLESLCRLTTPSKYDGSIFTEPAMWPHATIPQQLVTITIKVSMRLSETHYAAVASPGFGTRRNTKRYGNHLSHMHKITREIYTTCYKNDTFSFLQ